MSSYRQIFPPIIPGNVPAYDGSTSLRFYFQLSIANDRSQFQHAQIIISRLDSNINALNTVTYPLGIIFKKNNEILYDTSRKMYYFDLPSNLLAVDNYYKLQMRLGEQNLDAVGALNYIWLNNPTEVAKFSEWSSVCIIRPITPPEFGLVGYTVGAEPVYAAENSINIANTPVPTFVGFYKMMDLTKTETLKSYELKLYDYDSGLLLVQSGVKHIGEYAQQNIQYVFATSLEKGKYYNIQLNVTSKNGYTSSKVYKIYAMFVDSQIPNLLKTIVERDKAKITVSIATKKLRFEAMDGSSVVNYIKDGSVAGDILYTHAIIKNTFVESGDLDFYAINGMWVVQMKAMGIKPQDTLDMARKNPFLSFMEKLEDNSASPYYFKINLGAVVQKISRIGDQDAWKNDFILRKELYDASSNKLLATQESIYSMAGQNGSMTNCKFINPMNEYYFFIKEKNGYVTFYVEYLRTSTHPEMSKI